MGDSSECFAEMSGQELRKLTHALLLEWSSELSISNRGSFIDFRVSSTTALGIQYKQRFRLFLSVVTAADLQRLQAESAAVHLSPVAVVPLGLSADAIPPSGLTVIESEEYERLCKESGVVVFDDGKPVVDNIAYHELKDRTDEHFFFVADLLWLRTLSRNRLPPALRWAGKPAYDLFERCFFITMTATFVARGISWGTKNKGRVVPDGLLRLPGVDVPVLYDCKAAQNGYDMEYRDLTGFVDYLRHPIEGSWQCPTGVLPRFLVISSEIHEGTRTASFSARQRALAQKAPGSRLTWMRAPDLVRFGLALERAEVTPDHRATIDWTQLLDSGDLHWNGFRLELQRLTQLGYAFLEAD